MRMCNFISIHLSKAEEPCAWSRTTQGRVHGIWLLFALGYLLAVCDGSAVVRCSLGWAGFLVESKEASRFTFVDGHTCDW